MQVVKTVSVTVTGVLTVTAAPYPSNKGYVGVDQYVDVSWSPQPSLDYDVKVQWGDGTSTTKRVSTGTSTRVGPKRYTAAGSYTISVTVDELLYGYRGTASASLQVAGQLAASLKVSPAYGAAPLAATFTMGVTDGFYPCTWSLSPGDGSAPYTGTRSAAGPWTQTHTYTTVGTFTATLTVTDAAGATAIRRGAAQVDGVPTPPPTPMEAVTIIAPLVAAIALLRVSR